jgi:hypothetical protein
LSGTKILWGILIVLAVVLAIVWIATQWTAWRLGYQPQLGPPWFHVIGVAVYVPPVFFWWWYQFDAYAPRSGDRGFGRLCGDRHCHRHVGVAGPGGSSTQMAALGPCRRGSGQLRCAAHSRRLVVPLTFAAVQSPEWPIAEVNPQSPAHGNYRRDCGPMCFERIVDRRVDAVGVSAIGSFTPSAPDSSLVIGHPKT